MSIDIVPLRGTCRPKLALRAQTLNLPPFRFAKTCYRKNLNSRSKRLFQSFSGLIEENEVIGKLGERDKEKSVLKLFHFSAPFRDG